MRTPLRFATSFSTLLLGATFFVPASHAAAGSARPQGNSPEAILFNAANRDRVAIGLAPFQWDANLAAAARLHAQRIVHRQPIERIDRNVIQIRRHRLQHLQPLAHAEQRVLLRVPHASASSRKTSPKAPRRRVCTRSG